MKKINLKPLGDFAKDICGVVVSGLALSVLYNVSERVLGGNNSKAYVDYDDAVKAIMESSMLSSYKKEAMELLKPYGTMSYYKAVIYIVKDLSVLSSDKIKMIQSLSENS
jgi:hypothetical protein